MNVANIESQIVQGIRDWQSVFLPGSNLSLQQQVFLQRLLLMLAHVGLLVSDDGYHYTKHSSLPLVAYLNHGATIKIEMRKELLYPLLGYLSSVSVDNTNPLTQVSYLKPYTDKATETQSQGPTKATNNYSFAFFLGAQPVQLLVGVSRMLTGQASLNLSLLGYAAALQFPTEPKDKDPKHPFWQYQAYVISQGKQLYLPTKQLAIKATLTAEEFMHIQELSFDPQLIHTPPNEHTAEALAINFLVRLFSRFKQQDLDVKMQQFITQHIQPSYQAYLNIKPADYRARRQFLLAWMGKEPYVDPREILKLRADLAAHAVQDLTVDEQQKLLKYLLNPLIQTCSRELMALSAIG